MTTGGQFLQKFSQPGSSGGWFNSRILVIVDQRDRLIVAEYHKHRVVILDQAGTRLLTINGDIVVSNIRTALPWILKEISMLEPGVLKLSTFSHLIRVVRSYGNVKKPSRIVIDEEGKKVTVLLVN